MRIYAYTWLYFFLIYNFPPRKSYSYQYAAARGISSSSIKYKISLSRNPSFIDLPFPKKN